jgi:hypothetical protein
MPRRLFALILVAAALAAPPARAQPDPLVELARIAPLHVVLEIAQAAPSPHSVAEPCHLEGIVRRSYRPGSAPVVGQRLRIVLGCARVPLPGEGGAPLPAGIAALDVRYLAAGGLIEAHLFPGHGTLLPRDSWTVPRLLAVPSVSDTPRDVLPALGVPMPPGGWPERPRPPNFPLRDVVVTFRTSARPGETFRASYATGEAPWPMVRVEGLGSGAERAGATIYRPGEDRALRVWASPPRTQSIELSRDDRAGRLTINPHAFFTAEGTERVADLACTRWRIEDLLRRARAETACVTEDGVILRRTDAAGTTEAVAVAYGSRDRALFAPMLPAYMRQ